MSKKKTQEFVLVDLDTNAAFIIEASSEEDAIKQHVDTFDEPTGYYYVTPLKDFSKYEVVSSKVSIKRIK